MKKIINKLSVILLVSVFSVTFTSCLDSDAVDFGNGPILVQFENTTAEVNIIKDAAGTPIEYNLPVTFFGGKNVPLNRDVTLTVGVSANSQATAGVEFELLSDTFTIPAGETTANVSIRILTANLVPFDFKDVVLEITDSSESVSNTNTISLTLKALGADTLAGTYESEEGEYWNSGRFLGNFDHRTYVIEAISPDLYRHVGLAYWISGNNFYFTVDNDTGVITILPTDLDGEPVLLNGSPIMTCAGGQFEMIPCNDTVNKRTLMQDGAHVVELTVGYFRGVGATREFYAKLVRQP